MLLGIWKNVEELEESLNLDELRAIIDASRKKEHRANKFAAALKGIELDDPEGQTAKEKFEEIQNRVNAKLAGKSEDELAMAEFGIEIEIEE